LSQRLGTADMKRMVHRRERRAERIQPPDHPRDHSQQQEPSEKRRQARQRAARLEYVPELQYGFTGRDPGSGSHA
jgi:hypothetical protein